MKRFLILFGLICAILVSCGRESKKEQYVIKFAHLANEKNTWHRAAIKFKELVEARSQNKIQVKLYPNSQLGNELDIINSIQLGSADMTITGESLQNWAPSAALLAVPYAFDSSEQMRIAADSDAAKRICKEITAKTGLIPIAWFERGPRYLTSNIPIKKLDDLKGIKIRVPNVPVFIKVWEELGAKPVPMAFGEVFTSLQQSTIEAQENPVSLIESASFYEVQKYINLTAHVRSWIYVVISEATLNKIPEELKKIVLDAALEMQEYENSLFKEEEMKILQRLQNHGMVLIDSDQSEFSAKAKGAVISTLSEEQRSLLEKLKASNK